MRRENIIKLHRKIDFPCFTFFLFALLMFLTAWFPFYWSCWPSSINCLMAIMQMCKWKWKFHPRTDFYMTMKSEILCLFNEMKCEKAFRFVRIKFISLFVSPVGCWREAKGMFRHDKLNENFVIKPLNVYSPDIDFMTFLLDWRNAKRKKNFIKHSSVSLMRIVLEGCAGNV